MKNEKKKHPVIFFTAVLSLEIMFLTNADSCEIKKKNAFLF